MRFKQRDLAKKLKVLYTLLFVYTAGGMFMIKGRGTPVSLKPENKGKILSKLKEEYELYEFAKQRFYRQAKAWGVSADEE